MLNVLQLIPTLDRSGAEKQMVLLAEGLPRDRFRSEVAALTRLGPLKAELDEAGIPVTSIGKRHKVDPLALRRLTRFLREKRFDVIQTWIYAADTYGRVAAHQARVPVVVTSEMAVDLWKGRSELAVDRFLSRWTDRVVGNSNAVVEFYRKVGIPPEKLAMIPSGIADEEPPEVDPAAVRTELGLPADAPLVLFAGRLAEQKGVDTLLSSLDLLQHVRPDLRTLIVGEGPLRSRLEGLARCFTLLDQRRVSFLGHRDDVPRLLAASDLLVLPSLYEGLPNVVLEAMRFRKPVVATAAPGTTEVVEDGVTGILVPLRDPPALAQAIRSVIADPGRARAFGEAGRSRVEAEFGIALMVERFATLYEGLAREKGLLK
ncbi:glycosyltransferase [Tundrisphaera lichenicola]|uniref:glycosyltransferase n=1 Tax=Tundrisphaera lichenicola TaxID=2029860 RepID=UPI003EBC821B